MKRGSLRLGHIQSAAITLVVALGGLGYYYVTNLRSSQEHLVQQDLRVLAGIHAKVQQRLQSLEAASHSFLDATIHAHGKSSQAGYRLPESEVETVRSQLETAVRGTGLHNVTVKRRTAESIWSAQSDSGTAYSASLSGSLPSFRILHWESAPIWSANPLSAAADTGKVTFVISAIEPFSDLFASIGEQSEFDALLLALDTGLVVFQQSGQSSGIAVARFDSVINSDGRRVLFNSISHVAGSATLRTVNGEDHLVVYPMNGIVSRDDIGQVDSRDSLRMLRSTPKSRMVLCGIIREDHFTTQSKIRPHWIGKTFFTVLIFAVFAYFIINVTTIHRVERLRLSDALWAVGAALFATSAGVVVLLNMWSGSAIDERGDATLRRLADDIERRFATDIRAACAQLTRYDASCLNVATAAGQTQVQLRSGLWSMSDCDGPFAPFPVKLVFWINESGWLLAQWTSAPGDPAALATTSLVNVGSRWYFQAAKNNSMWHVTDTVRVNEDSVRINAYEFALQPVYSLTTAKFATELSMRSNIHAGIGVNLDTPRVAAVEFDPPSLTNPVLPEGYGFAIIDDTGSVLYHSDPTKRLRENFFREIDSTPAVREAVAARLSLATPLQYDGVARYAVVRPLSDVPWHIVVFADRAQLDGADTKTLWTAAVLGIVNLLPLLIVGMWLVLLSSRRVTLAIRLYQMWPARQSARTYERLIALFAALSLLLVAMALWGPASSELVWLASAAPHAGLIVMFVTLRRDTNRAALPLSLSGIRATLVRPRYANDASVLGLGIAYMLLAAAVTAVFLFSATLTMWSLGAAVGLAVIVLAFDRWDRSARPADRSHNTERYALWYYRAAATGILLIAAAPMVMMYRAAHDHEADISARRACLRMAGALADRSAALVERHKGKPMTHTVRDILFASPGAACYPAGLADSAHDISFDAADSPGRSERDPLAAVDELLAPPDRVYGSMDGGVRNQPRWERTSDAGRVFAQSSVDGSGRTLHIRATLPTFSATIAAQIARHPATGIAFAIGMLVFLVLFYRGMRTVLQYVLLDIHDPPQLPPDEHAVMGVHSDDASRNLLWVVPSDEGRAAVMKRLGDLTIAGAPAVFDCERITAGNTHLVEISVRRWVDRRTVVLDHFEFGIDDPAINAVKLALMETLWLTHGIHLIVISAMSPVYYAALRSAAEKEDESSDGITPRWVRMFEGFEQRIAMGVDVDARDTFSEALRKADAHRRAQRPGVANDDDAELLDALAYECGSFPPLMRIGASLVREPARFFAFNVPQLRRVIRERAAFFYRRVWFACDKDEKTALINLSRDRIVAIGAREVLDHLEGCGLVVRDPAPRPFNESFAEFVGTMRVPSEITRREEAVTSALWRSFRTPALLALGALAVFFFMTQEGSFSSTLSVAAAAATMLPGLLKLMDSWRSKSKG